MSDDSRLTANQEILITRMLSFDGHEAYRKEIPDPSKLTKREFHLIYAVLHNAVIKERFPKARDFIDMVNLV